MVPIFHMVESEKVIEELATGRADCSVTVVLERWMDVNEVGVTNVGMTRNREFAMVQVSMEAQLEKLITPEESVVQESSVR